MSASSIDEINAVREKLLSLLAHIQVLIDYAEEDLEPLSEEERRQVFEIDDHILAHEFIALMDYKLVEETPRLQSQPEFAFQGFEPCAREFLTLFSELI